MVYQTGPNLFLPKGHYCNYIEYYRYIYHKPKLTKVIGVIFTNLANELGHHLVSMDHWTKWVIVQEDMFDFYRVLRSDKVGQETPPSYQVGLVPPI